MSDVGMGSSLRLPLTILVTLVAMIVACAGLLFGFSVSESVPLPSSIGVADREDGSGKITFSRTFSLDRPARSGVLWLAVAETGRAEIGGVPIVADVQGTAKQGTIGSLQPGLHTVSVEVQPGSSRPLAIGYLEIDGMPGRIVTDGSWNARSEGGSTSAAVSVGRYGEPPFGPVFGELSDSRKVPKGAGFWAPLIALIVATCIASLAGPLLRPAGRSGRDMEVVDLAVIVPSIIYGSAAFLITGLAGLGAGPGVILSLHVVATTVFVLVLVAWKSGGKLAERDREIHRAELSGYDSFQTAFELAAASVEGQPEAFRSAVRSALSGLGEAVRYAGTTAATPEVDREILSGLQSLEVEAATPDSDPADFQRRIAAISALIKRREILAASTRRA